MKKMYESKTKCSSVNLKKTMGCFLLALVMLLVEFGPYGNYKAYAATTNNINVGLESVHKHISRIEGKEVVVKDVLEYGIERRIKDRFIKEEHNGTTTEEEHQMDISYDIPEKIFDMKSEGGQFGLKEVYADGGKIGNYGADSSGTIRCRSTIFYALSVINGRTYVRLKRAKGKLVSLTGYSGSLQGSGIYITSNNVVIGCGGPDKNGRYYQKSKRIKCEAKPCEWRFKPANPWAYIADEPTLSVMNTQQTVKLKRGTTTWKFTFMNSVL